MIIDFRFKNHGSFKDDCTISFLASAQSDKKFENLFKLTKLNGINNKKNTIRIFNQIGILGPNASGKSNIIGALFSYAKLINGFQNKEEMLGRNYFKLDGVSSSKPTEFEINFIHKNIRYHHYIAYTDKIQEESLYYFPKGSAKKIFVRSSEEISITDEIKAPFRNFYASPGILSSADTLVGEFIKHKIFNLNEIFSQVSYILFIGNNKGISIDPISLYNLQSDIPRAMPWVKMADLGIESISVSDEGEEISENDEEYIERLRDHFKDDISADELENRLERYRKKRKLTFMHNGAEGAFPLDLQLESFGTNAWVNLIHNVLKVIDKGGVLVVDELDASLHPLLVGQIIRIFNSNINKRNAQLIFSTHDTNVLSSHGEITKICPEQTYLVEKNRFGESSEYLLSDFDTKDYDLEELYLAGKLGAVPNIFALPERDF